MVDEPGNHIDAQGLQARQPPVCPGPVEVPATTLDTLPEKGIPQRSETQRGDAIEVVLARGVTGQFELVHDALVEPGDRALHAAPEIRGVVSAGLCRGQAGLASASRRESPTSLLYKVSA